MKWIQTGRWMPAALLLAVGGTTGRAEELAIQSFDGAGQLTFAADGSATNYCIEWASSPSGPWTNTWPNLLDIPASVSGVVTCCVPTCSVPMFYRVVATAHPYLVVDLSGGPSALSYPVTYLDAVPPGGWTDEHKTDKLVLRRIPATTPDFTMGSRATDYPGASNSNLHQVTLSTDFYIGVFEVTQKQWERVMGSWPSYFTNTSYRDSRPVEQVSYYDIRENPANSDDPAVDWPNNSAVRTNSFMGKLRAKTGLSGFDLPTESQWEYACRAGTTTALNSGYDLTSKDYDSHMAEVGRYYDNHPGGYSGSSSVSTSGGTAAAGSYQANAWGLYDMHGNVWEWCLDWYGTTYPESVSDPLGATSGTHRTVRGGSWSFLAERCYSAWRIGGGPGTQQANGGFRACCAP